MFEFWNFSQWELSGLEVRCTVSQVRNMFKLSGVRRKSCIETELIPTFVRTEIW